MSTSTDPKRTLLAAIARLGGALASPLRLALLELLAQGERSVEELARRAGASVANTSQHLQRLKAAGLVTARADGVFVRYRLAGDEVVGLLGALDRVGRAHVADVEHMVRDYLHARDALEPVAQHELLERARKGLVTVLDVRPADEFASGHLPGALNIPLAELARRLRELPRGREVVAYCRGPWCLMSMDAVALLRRKGVRARRLEDGLPEWRAAGRPVELPIQPASR